MVEIGVQRWLSEGGFDLLPAAVTTIPVAVHVVRYDDGSADVEDDQIHDQIAVLNAAYSNTNFE